MRACGDNGRNFKSTTLVDLIARWQRTRREGKHENPRAEGFLVGRDVLRLRRGRHPRRAWIFPRRGRQNGTGLFSPAARRPACGPGRDTHRPLARAERRTGSALSRRAAGGDCGGDMPVRRDDRAARSRPFARRLDADVGLRRRAISVAGNGRIGGRARRLFRRRFCLCAGPPAQYLAEPVLPMDVISNLGLGFAVALTIQNIAYCFIGVLLGTIIGVLPGIGPVTTVAMLLPISFTLQPESALILLAGIYYGAQYGGSTTAILVNIPGEASSVVTTIDGHQMARQGRAGPALGIAALGSFFAGSVATLLIALAAPPLAAIALQFGPAEYFSLMVCGLVAAVVLARGSLVKAIAMVVLGLLLGLVGTDVNTGARRFNFGMMGLADGIEFVAISMAIYGIAEVRRCAGSILRGTGLGAILGVLPGGGALLASFAAYTLEKKVARPPREFG